ncbi:MAG: hypothetical protein AAB850_01840 [Patescibacteria group bacterium]
MPAKKTWYVEAVGHTNEAIAAELPTENAHKGVLCQDGVKRDFWECDYRFITKLLQSEAAEHLQFKVFYREGRYGPVKPWPFLRKRRMTLAEALRKEVVKRSDSSKVPRPMT